MTSFFPDILLDHMGVVKFVDFGAAKIIAKGHAKTMARATRSRMISNPNGLTHNSLTGTPMYMSPESIKGNKQGKQGAMDIWSLGCVVLECATGRKPWNSALDNPWCVSRCLWNRLVTNRSLQGNPFSNRVRYSIFCSRASWEIGANSNLLTGKVTTYLSFRSPGNSARQG